MKTLQFLFLGLLAAIVSVCHAQNVQPGDVNVQNLSRPAPTVITSDMIEALQAGQGGSSPALEQPEFQNPPQAIAEAVTPDIQALANGLQDNPERIFDYVHDHIRYVFYFGSKKGAELTLLEKSGNDFDQCALLVALLRAAGYTNVQYQFGWMLMPYDDDTGANNDLHHWLQLTLNNSNWATTSNYLANLIYVRGYPTYAAYFGNNIFGFQRVWVTMNYATYTNYLDPAFKVSMPVAGINLQTAAGISSNALMTAAAGTDTGTYVTNLNEAALRSTLTGYTSNLLSYIQSNYPNATPQQILGGWQIQPNLATTLPTSELFTIYNFGGVLPVQTWTYEPTNMMSSLTVSFANTNYFWWMPQFEGQRLTLTYSTNGLAQLWQDDNLLVQQQATAGESNVVLYAHHPVGNWNPTNNTFIDNDVYDQNVTNTYQWTNSTYDLLYAFEPDWGWLQKRENMLNQYISEGLPLTSRQVVSETLNVMGLGWMLQTYGSQQLLCQQLAVLPMNYHRLGRMAQEGGNGYYVDAYMEENSDFPSSGLTAVSSADYYTELELKDYFASAQESSIIEQTESSNLTAASTVQMLETAATNKQAIYAAYYGNWTSVESALKNYSAADLATLTAYINDDDALLLPQNGSNHVTSASTSWAGYGAAVIGNTIGMIISGGYNGGYNASSGSTADSSSVQQTGNSQSTSFTQTPIANAPISQTTADPIDTADGTYQVQNTDLALGQSEPRGITFSRYYNGTRRFANSAGMSDGWIHNYIVNATAAAAPQASLGYTTPQQMAPMLVASCAAINTYYYYNIDPKNWMVGALIAKWGIDQITYGGVSINLGKDTLQFVQQPTGAFTPPAGCTATLTQNGSSYSLKMRHGNKFNFDSLGRLTNIVDQYSQPLNVTYLNSTSSLPQTVTDWKGRTLTFNYTGGQLTSVTDSSGRSVSYNYSDTYNPQGDLTSYTDPEGKTCTYAYDTNHDIIASFDANNQLVVSNLFDVLGHVTTQYVEGNLSKMWQIFWCGWDTVEYDPSTNVSLYEYDDQGRVTAMADPMQQYNEMVYDGQNHVIYNVSPLYEINQFFYDGNNNLIGTIDQLGYTNQYIYDTNNNFIETIDPRGNISRFGYNSEFSLTGQTNGAGNWENYVYTTSGALAGTLASRTDAGGTTTYGYDSTYGQLTNITYPSGLGSEGFANSSLGDVTSHTDGRGFVTTFSYNNRRQLTNSIEPTNLVTKTAYDPVGNIASTTDARGNTTIETWSPVRNLTSTILPNVSQGTPVLTNTYDIHDWLIGTRDPLQNSTSYGNNPDGLTISQTDPLQRTTTFGYDADSRKIATTNAVGETTYQTWDNKGELIDLIDGAGHTSVRGYDAAGNQIVLTNRNGYPWRFSFDGANRLTNTVSPLGNSTSVVLNNQGLPSSMKDPKNQITTYGYDGKWRLTNRADSVGTTLYSYDANDNQTKVSENGLTNYWTYDAYNRVSSYTDVYGNQIQYRYDANGNVTNLIYPGGRNVFYTYDSNNHLTSVVDWSGRLTTLTYDLDGRITKINRPNGTYRSISYDSAGEITNILEQMANGLPIALMDFSWDLAARMQWEFIAPLPHTNAPSPRTLTYNADNELTNVDGYNVSVDNDGNLVSGPLTNDTAFAYTFDARNRLQNVGGVTNIYDAIDNRIGQAYGTNLIAYVVNPNTKLPEVLERIKNGITTYYIYGPALLYQITETPTVTNTLSYHYDYRGSTIALSGDNGLVTDRMEYSLYGSLTYRAGTNDTPFLFTGGLGVMSDPNGLLYMRARYYSPYLCRWLNPDPSGFSAGLNLYAYANGNPASMTDPSGLDATSSGGYTSWDMMLAASVTIDPNNPYPYSQITIECHGVSAGGFNGNVNSFAGITTIPGSGPDAMQGYSDLDTLSRMATPFIAGPVGGLIGDSLDAGISAGTGVTLNQTFTWGNTAYYSFQTSQGSVGVSATLVQNGDQLILNDIAVYPEGSATSLQIGPSQVMQMRNIIANEAQSQGYNSIQITGQRFSGANPGKMVNVNMNLGK